MGLWGGPQKWYLYNLDTDEELEGQFVAEEINHEVGSVYSERYALNRRHPILQFVHGLSETVSFKGRFFMISELGGAYPLDPKKQLDILKKWSVEDTKLHRPPLLAFWVADGHLGFANCVLERLSGINYTIPARSGQLRDVTFTVNLRQFYPYELEVSGTGETRYHRSRHHDYYEMLTYREYRNPDIGDIIRKRHPTKAIIEIGDIIKLPSASAIKKDKVKQTSIALRTAFGYRDTAQRSRRIAMFDSRNVVRTSHLVQGE